MPAGPASRSLGGISHMGRSGTPVDAGIQANNAWRVLALLFLANLLNIYDRMIPAVVAESLRLEFQMTDVHLGFIASAFTLVYALSGIPLGRLADTTSRRVVIGTGLAVWSGLTALTGWATGFVSFILARIGVGVGEASFAPAATSLISDLFPPGKRSRATAIFMLGLPVGMILGFITVGLIVDAFDSWRAPFFIAAVPGLLLAVVFFYVKEPQRGESENRQENSKTVIDKPFATILKIPTFWWVIFSGVGFNFASYSVIAFIVPLLQRYFVLELKEAALIAGVLIGLAGLVGTLGGGFLADQAQRWSPRGRLVLSGSSMFFAALMIGIALQVDSIHWFAWIFGLGWMAAYVYPVCTYPVIQDLVTPQLRSTAMGVYFAGMHLLGAAFGTIALGLLSDHLAELARVADGAEEIADIHRALGLHQAMLLIPAAIFLAAFASFMASRSFVADAALAKSQPDYRYGT